MAAKSAAEPCWRGMAAPLTLGREGLAKEEGGSWRIAAARGVSRRLVHWREHAMPTSVRHPPHPPLPLHVPPRLEALPARWELALGAKYALQRSVCWTPVAICWRFPEALPAGGMTDRNSVSDEYVCYLCAQRFPLRGTNTIGTVEAITPTSYGIT